MLAEVQALPVGPMWHDSMQKRQEDAYYATQLEEMAIRLTGRTLLALTAEIPAVKIISQKRVGLGGILFELLKAQHEDNPDNPLGSSGPAGPIAEFVSGLAMDEFIQIKHISKNPDNPSDMSFIGVRPQMPEEISRMRKVMYAHGYGKEFNTWLNRYCQMRPGIFGPTSLLEHSGLQKGTLDFYLARAFMDSWYYENASHEVDKFICMLVAVAGAKRLRMGLAA
jgi:lipopolysaccharide/colanic/teichoic acid biosynthesis glycosyltransferase